MVDLAGSERVSKTGTIGVQLSEAKHINLSLHHLESVIIALQKESNAVTSAANASRASLRPFSSQALEMRLYNRLVERTDDIAIEKCRMEPCTCTCHDIQR